MSEDLYVNKNGFKCVMTQLAKTSGVDPVEHAQLQNMHRDDNASFKAALKQAKVRVAKYAEE